VCLSKLPTLTSRCRCRRPESASFWPPLASFSAPAASRMRRHSAWPKELAWCAAVQPFLSASLTFAPPSRRTLSTRRLPLCAATDRTGAQRGSTAPAANAAASAAAPSKLMGGTASYCGARKEGAALEPRQRESGLLNTPTSAAARQARITDACPAASASPSQSTRRRSAPAVSSAGGLWRSRRRRCLPSGAAHDGVSARSRRRRLTQDPLVIIFP